jgi:phage/plasmid-like protein (TIGR03299 family)
MAHNLNKTNGKWSFAAKGEKAWHGLGQYVEEAMTSEQAIKLGGLDYTVEKRPLFTPGKEGENAVEVPGFFTNVRTDTNQPLGIVANRYRIVQNKDAFCFFDSIIDKGEAIFETAGALGLGERIFITAKLPEDMEVRGEKIEKYILLTNSHDGNSSIIAGFTPIRVVCNNTLQASLRNLDNKVSIAHTASAESRLSEAARLMGIASKYMNEVNLIFEDMTKKKVSDVDIDEFISNIFLTKKVKDDLEKDPNTELSTRMKNIIEDVKEFTLYHPTQTTEAAYRTLWGLYNGVSGYFTHVKEYKSAEQKMYDMNYNGAADKISKAFDLAVKMI